MALNLTAKDQQILIWAFQCMENTKVDNVKLARLGNYKNPATASAIWAAVKKKLLAGANGGDAAKAAGATASPASKKRGVNDGKGPKGSAKKARKGNNSPIMGGRGEGEEDDDDVDDEEDQQQEGIEVKKGEVEVKEEIIDEDEDGFRD